MSNTSNLVLPYLAVGQAQKHVTVNETLRKLDAIIQLSVVSATTTAEPSTPTDGAVYIVPAGKSGAHWSAFANGSLGYYRDGAWVEIAPREGWLAFVKDTDQLLAFTGSAWSLFPAAKLLTLSASDKLLGRSTAGAGAAEEIVCTAAGRAILDDADATAQRATLGLGTMATQAASSYAALSGAMFTGVTGVAAGIPQFDWRETGAAANGKNWRWEISGGVCGLYLVNDALNSATGVLSITRSGLSVSNINFNHGVTIGAPTGGNKGAGTLNATAVYDDNVLLSCYVFDQALDGAIDLAKWDSKAPPKPIAAKESLEQDMEGPFRPAAPQRSEPRLHEPARRFAERAGTKHDPLTLDGYARHWKEKRHLTSMPNEERFDPEDNLAMGAWTQRLIETVEIQAVLIERLNERLKVLEATTRRA